MMRRIACRAAAASLFAASVSASIPAARAQPSSGDSSAEESSRPETYVISAIVVRGLVETRRPVVDQLLDVRVGESVTRSQLEEAIGELRQTGIFKNVTYRLRDRRVDRDADAPPRSNHRVLHIQIDERWTWFPLLELDPHPELTRISAGLRNPNVLGRFFELGLLYSWMIGTHSVEVWYRDRFFLATRTIASAEAEWNRRPRYLYDGDGAIEGGYLRFRRGGAVGAAYPWTDSVTGGLTLGVYFDQYSQEKIPARITGRAGERNLPNDKGTLSIGTDWKIGRISPRGFRFQGGEYVHRIEQGIPLGSDQRLLWKTRGTLRLFGRLPGRSTLATRFAFGFSASNHPDQQFFIGGYPDVRGFPESRFRGLHFWLGNLEVRIPSFVDDAFVLQHVGFLDGAGTSDRLTQLWDVDGASAGLGLRGIFPKMHNLTLRLDVGIPFTESPRVFYSFGTGQWF